MLRIHFIWHFNQVLKKTFGWSPCATFSSLFFFIISSGISGEKKNYHWWTANNYTLFCRLYASHRLVGCLVSTTETVTITKKFGDRRLKRKMRLAARLSSSFICLFICLFIRFGCAFAWGVRLLLREYVGVCLYVCVYIFVSENAWRTHGQTLCKSSVDASKNCAREGREGGRVISR